MIEIFSLPGGAIGVFAVVKLWPEIKAAEDECIARLKIAAQSIGVDCIEVDADGNLFSEPGKRISKQDVDFVLHLHYDTPKRYDAVSIVALWNPIKFYHEWGYQRCSRNLLSHDDFVSCSSDAADDHVARMIRGQNTHLPPLFRLYHSTARVVRPPSLGEGKLFYAGINWEALSGGRSRHQDVLKLLDETGMLRIYGPTIFQGVRVWAGYKSYVREVPFDGISMIEEISKAGVALVLSSQSHKDSELMSNRLFESIAAGALVICDENPFGKRFFGDSLLYIDTRLTAEQIRIDILGHLDWVRGNPKSALLMIEKAQGIFKERFSLTRNLRDLYDGLTVRKKTLSDRQNPPDKVRPRVLLNLLMPDFDMAVLTAHMRSIAVQEYNEITPVLVIGSRINLIHRVAIEEALLVSAKTVKLLEIEFYDYGIQGGLVRRKMGAVVQELLRTARDSDALILVAPNEVLFSNHVSVLAGALQRDLDVNVASVAALIRDGLSSANSIHEVLDFAWFNIKGPTGFGRFIFRLNAIPNDVGVALRYLDHRCIAVLIGDNVIAQQLPVTMDIHIGVPFPTGSHDETAETAIIRDYSPRVLNLVAGLHAVASPVAAVPQAPSRGSSLRLRKFLNWRWLSSHWNLLRAQGFKSRFQVLRRKLMYLYGPA
jgi:hypothetical protein